jgi:hypothetical protein
MTGGGGRGGKGKEGSGGNMQEENEMMQEKNIK